MEIEGLPRQSRGYQVDQNKTRQVIEHKRFLIFLATINKIITFRDNTGNYMFRFIIRNLKSNSLQEVGHKKQVRNNLVNVRDVTLCLKENAEYKLSLNRNLEHGEKKFLHNIILDSSMKNMLTLTLPYFFSVRLTSFLTKETSFVRVIVRIQISPQEYFE